MKKKRQTFCSNQSELGDTFWRFAITIICIVFITNISPTNSFSQNDDKYEYVPIEFDLETGAFNRILPFDQPFLILINNIDKSINHIRVEIFEHKQSTKEKINFFLIPDDLEDYEKVKEHFFWNRKSDCENSVQLKVMYKLRPNKEYFVDVVSITKISLSDTEKAALETGLRQDKSIQDFITRLTLAYFNDSDKLPNYNLLDEYQKEFNDRVGKAIRQIDPNYGVDPIQLKSQLLDFANYVNAFSELHNNIETIEKKIKSDSSFSEHTRAEKQDQLRKFRSDIKKLNWGSTNLTSTGLSDMEGFFDQNIVNGIQVPESMRSMITSIDDFFGDIIDLQDKFIAVIIDYTVVPKTYRSTGMNTTYRTDFVKNAKLYVTLDLGLSYVWQMDRIVTYSGVNIYFRPMNKNIPLSNYRGWHRLAVGSSLLVGITLNSVEKDGVRKGVFGTSALVLGGGYRVNPFLKVNAGTFVYYSLPNNPLISPEQQRTTFSPFVSISIDLDVKPLFAGIGEAIFR